MDNVYIQGDTGEQGAEQAENWRLMACNLKADIAELENMLAEERRAGHKARNELNEYKDKYKVDADMLAKALYVKKTAQQRLGNMQASVDCYMDRCNKAESKAIVLACANQITAELLKEFYEWSDY